MMQKKTLCLAGLTAVMLSAMCSGCALFPEEEVYPTAPVIQAYEEVTYKQTPVIRGDMTLEEAVICKYVSAQEETLRFMVGDEYIDGVYVVAGQEVKAGDILASLEENGLAEQIIKQEYVIRNLELKLTQAEENWQLSLRQLDAWDDTESEDYAEAKGLINRNYELEKQDLEDSLHIENMRLAQMKSDQASRNLYAPMDATVTYAREITVGQKSVAGEAIIMLADMTNNMFTVTGDQAAYFEVGETVTIEVSENELEAYVMDAAALGLAQEEGGTQIAYLKLVTPDPTLKNGIKGTVNMLLDSRTDTLYVEKEAVQTAGGKRFVYMLNEDGLRVMQDVTTGLENKDYIEITSGLSEGDSVILN